jgi:two-component system chemotaxis response regulator CheB
MLPGTFPLPILIVQHMPPMFTRLLAERLDQKCALHVREASNGMTAGPGDVIIAPGGQHLEVASDGPVFALRVTDEPAENSCRPAVDVLFRTAASHASGRIIGVILTGMGHDGLAGCQLLKERGDTIVAQDESSSVVWGMPGSVVAANVTDIVAPLHEIAGELLRLAARTHRPVVNS